MPYTRKELIELRNYQQQQQPCSSINGQLIPEEIRREPATTGSPSISSSSSESNAVQIKPVIKRYTREQLVTIRDNQNLFCTTSLPVELPDDLRRMSRFRCDSNCVNEQQHKRRQILKYTRNELLRYRQQSTATSCAVENKRAMEAQSMAPEIFRPLGH